MNMMDLLSVTKLGRKKALNITEAVGEEENDAIMLSSTRADGAITVITSVAGECHNLDLITLLGFVRQAMPETWRFIDHDKAGAGDKAWWEICNWIEAVEKRERDALKAVAWAESVLAESFKDASSCG